MNNKIVTYVLHHPPLVERKQSLLRDLAKHNISAYWVEGFKPEEVIIPEKTNLITNREYSLYSKFRYALEHQIKNNFSFSFIIEDDIILPDNFIQYFEEVFSEFLNLNCDLLILGTAFNLVPKNLLPGKKVYYDPSYTTRCAHAIVYSLEAAKKIVPNMETGLKGYDHKLNDIILEQKLKTCWVEPGLYQGSRMDTPTTYKWQTSLR